MTSSTGTVPKSKAELCGLYLQMQAASTKILGALEKLRAPSRRKPVDNAAEQPQQQGADESHGVDAAMCLEVGGESWCSVSGCFALICWWC